MIACLLFALAVVVIDPMIGRMLGGDRRAGNVILARLLPVIRARAWRCLRRAPPAIQRVLDVDDLTQEAWTRLLADDGAALRNHEPTRSSLETYVGMVAERAVLNVIETQRAAKRGAGLSAVDVDDAPIPSKGAAPDQTAVDRDLLNKLGQFLNGELPERGRLIFRMLYTDGFSAQQVAQAIGVNDQVIYNWRHKIRKLTADFMATA